MSYFSLLWRNNSIDHVKYSDVEQSCELILKYKFGINTLRGNFLVFALARDHGYVITMLTFVNLNY